MAEIQGERSSNIAWARYDKDTGVLEIDFKDSKGKRSSTYAYDNYPLEEWDKFCVSESRGRFFAYEIRPRFQGRKVEREKSGKD